MTENKDKKYRITLTDEQFIINDELPSGELIYVAGVARPQLESGEKYTDSDNTHFIHLIEMALGVALSQQPSEMTFSNEIVSEDLASVGQAVQALLDNV